MEIKIKIAPKIREESWLNRDDPEMDRFRKAYGHASNMTLAIPSLAAVTPEAAYWIWVSIQHGMERVQRDADGEDA